MKIILAGTPTFASNIFEEIINNKKIEVVAIITQPDKPIGRGQKTTFSPVKLLALKYKIPLYQPEKIIDIYDNLKEMDFDIFLTIAFGQYIPAKILDLKKNSFINIHGSLLPKYRGAAPIQRAIFNGETKTGFCLIYMINKMDAGDIIMSQELDIDSNDTSLTLFLKMENEIRKIISDWLLKFWEKKFSVIKQEDSLTTNADKLTKEESFLVKDTSFNMINKIRAFNENPGAYFYFQNKRVKIFQASYEYRPNSILIETNDKNIYAFDFQFEGKKRRQI
ncbi:MAG: methionyl-tRNA formyltransferase [Metamycoplasmataceae bacterium]